MALYIADPETAALVERLAEHKNCNKTAAVAAAVRKALEEAGLPVTIAAPNRKSGILADLEADLRRDTRAYVRVREEVTGARSRTRVYQMLGRHKVTHGAGRAVRGSAIPGQARPHRSRNRAPR